MVLLLHGWTANADLNFFTCYRPLGEHFRVVAIDHRGHGRGIRTRKAFRLEDCADDAAALCDLLGIDRVIPIGYSMGGTIAQLMWRRHPQLVRGLVLGATSAYFRTSRQEQLGFIGLGGLARIARLTPSQARSWALHQFYLKGKAATWEPWALEQVAQHDWRMVLEAGKAIGAYDARHVARRGRRAGQHDRDDARPRRAGAPPDPPVPGDQGLRGVPHRRRPRRDPRQAGVPSAVGRGPSNPSSSAS